MRKSICFAIGLEYGKASPKEAEKSNQWLYIYTSGVEYYYSYPKQYENMFRLKLKDNEEYLQLRYIKESDHVYTMLEDREYMITSVCEWMTKYYGSGEAEKIAA